MKSVAAKLGSKIEPEHFRALAAAAFADMEHQRIEAGYCDESVIGGIAYSAFLAEEMQQLTK